MKLSLCEVSKAACKYLIMRYHYSGRVPGIKYCWGLREGSRIVGCVVFSIPASYTLCRGVCGVEYSKYVLELSRLVITTQTKNAASYLVGNALRRLPDAIVVSYADCNDHVGHIGYVYQATNWLYTGHASCEPIWLHPDTGEIVSYTRRHIDVKAKQLGLEWTELERKTQKGKHRYVIFTGNKKFKKEVRKQLRYKVIDKYPKGSTRRHEVAVDAVIKRKRQVG